MNSKPSYRAANRRDPLPPLDSSAFVDAPKKTDMALDEIGAIPVMPDKPLIFLQRYETPGIIPQARLIVVCCVLSTIAAALAFFRR